MTIALRYTVRSDVGLLREGNEDAAYAGPYLLAIADGMGGHAAGEVASAVAISTLAPLDTDTTGIDMLQALGDAIAAANEELRRITIADPATEGMGTTVTALLWSGDKVAMCHIGDSRGYLLRDGELQQITHDHTLVQSLVDEGRLTPEAAASHPQRSLVMRALQSSIPADPDLTLLQAKAGDRYLLCSDGLTDVVSDETLRTTLSELTDLDAAVEQLVDLAIRSGGPDNITCVLADVVDTDAGATPSDEVIIVGALITGAAGSAEATRSDNPAARAHLLAQSQAAPGQLASEDQNQGQQIGNQSPADEGAQGGPGPGLVPTGQAPPANTGQGDQDDDTYDASPRWPRRRWPVVSCVLMLLIGVVGAAGYYGWRLTQNEYYVGTADGHVVVFRGVSQAVAGVRLSSVVQRTDIPLSALPSSEAGSIKSTIGPESNLKQARRIISQFRQDYHCAVVQADISRWAADRPKPVSVTAKPKKAASGPDQSTAKSAPAENRPAKSTSAKSTGAKSTNGATRPSTTRATSAGGADHGQAAPSKDTTPKSTTPKSTTPKSTTAKSTTAKTAPSKPKNSKAKTAKSAVKHRSHKHQATSRAVRIAYPPEPVMPAYCPAFSGAAG
jgi:serine/threonine protein phosphatase PrpC